MGLANNKTSTTHVNKTTSQVSDSNKSALLYVVSNWKLAIMSITTFGLYDIYWFYKQWKSFGTETNVHRNNLLLLLNSIFAPITSYYLFKRISEITKQTEKKNLEPSGLAVIYFFLSRIYLGFVSLIPVQKRINLYWEQKYGDNLVRSPFGVWNWIIAVSFVLLVMYGISSEETSSDPHPDSSELAPSTSTTAQLDRIQFNQEEVASSVVNIFCPSFIDEEESSGGSGTIITEDGLILTNSHIIPQNEKDLHVDDEGCLVVLPDPSTGQPNEMYLAHPVVISELSDKYDLAFVYIYAAYFDEDTNEPQGIYPRKFPGFDDSERCKDENVKLGESVRIFGYPSISGGYSLTITDGVVSSFPGDGLIVTSAKISHGNSGGLAVDANGCMLGVPSLVSADENESLGVIYSMELVSQFTDEVTAYMNE